MKKILFALCAALTLCGCAQARRPWTEALALVSPDAAGAAAAKASAPVSADAPALVTSADVAPVSRDVPAPAASPDAAVSGDRGGAASGDAAPASADEAPVGVPYVVRKGDLIVTAFRLPPESGDASVSSDLSADVSSDVSADEVPEFPLVSMDAPLFTAEAPENWLLEEIDETSAAVCAPDNSAAVIVTVIPAGKTTLRRAAEQLASRHGGFKTLKRLPDTDGTGDAWEYRGMLAGQPIYAQVFDLPKKRFGTIVIWKDPDAPDATEIFNSIRFK